MNQAFSEKYQIFRDHLFQTVQSLNFAEMTNKIEEELIYSKQIYLEKNFLSLNFFLSSLKLGKKTVIFDLDETLVHCNESKDMPCDVLLPIMFQTEEVVEAGINIRPYTLECLHQLSEHYEIIVFTASHNCYANVVLDYLDPEGKLISQRLFREHCIQSEEGVFIKDLRVLGNRDLNEMVIVDNAAYSFAFHLGNGIPIIPFYENKNDKELYFLTKYLIELVKHPNIALINSRVFGFEQYCQYYEPEILLEKIYPSFFVNQQNQY